MTLTHLSVRNFQSLKKVDLELGDFTVIVGASSSGKSALIRACRALASNVRGAGVITRGQKSTAITARTDTHAVTLSRSESSGAYSLVDASGAQLTFTKLAGAVPEPVTRALRIEPVTAAGSSVNFASQFDRPYLLDDSGANVARVLGELTNVNTIFEAVRTANKVRLAAAGTLKTRTGDLQALQGRLADFHGLGERLNALESAETLAAQAATCQRSIERLQKALMSVHLAQSALDKAQRLPAVPPGEPMTAALDRVSALTGVLERITANDTQAARYSQAAATHAEQVQQLQGTLHEMLHTAGVCPTCGRSTRTKGD